MERVKVKALRDVTIVLPVGEEATLNADHAEHLAGMGLIEIIQDAQLAPSETKPASPLETKPAKGATARKGR